MTVAINLFLAVPDKAASGMLRLVARKWRLDNEIAAIDWPSGTKRVFRREHRSSMFLQPQGGCHLCWRDGDFALYELGASDRSLRASCLMLFVQNSLVEASILNPRARLSGGMRLVRH